MRVLINAIILLLFTLSASAQMSVSYFPFVSVLQAGTNTERTFWADWKLVVNTNVSNMDMEISPKWNFHKGSIAHSYVGIGPSINLSYIGSTNSVLNGYLLDFGTRIKPISKIPEAQVVFEVSPYVNRHFEGGKLRARLGVSWNFSGSKQKKAVPPGTTEVQ
jgi:hypothetical protein